MAGLVGRVPIVFVCFNDTNILAENTTLTSYLLTSQFNHSLIGPQYDISDIDIELLISTENLILILWIKSSPAKAVVTTKLTGMFEDVYH